MSTIFLGPFQRQMRSPCRHFGHPTEAALLAFRQANWADLGCSAETLPAYSHCPRCQLWCLKTAAKRWPGWKPPVVKVRRPARKSGDKKGLA